MMSKAFMPIKIRRSDIITTKNKLSLKLLVDMDGFLDAYLYLSVLIYPFS